LFEEQDQYRESVLPKAVTKRLSVEAGVSFGCYTGSEGATVSINEFGSSAPGNVTMEKFGFTVDNASESKGVVGLMSSF